MRANRGIVQSWIGLSEGRYVNHPDDPGGATDRGITQATYDAWNKLKGNPRRTVRGISKEVAEQIIYEQYMRPVRFDDLPAGLDYAVADFAVNSGPRQAAVELQRLVGVDDDGIIGDKTLAAIMQRDAEKLIAAYCDARLKFMRGLKNWKTFKGGWTTRVMGKNAGVQTSDIGVVDRAVKLHRAQREAAPAHIPAPVPVADAGAKARPENTAELTWWQRALSDPATLVPAVGGVLTPLVGNDGPIQWALAAVIVIGAVYAVVRALRKART